MRDKTFLRFLVVGGANTLLGLAIIFLFRQFMPDTWANFLGFAANVPVTYTTHKKMTFGHHGQNARTFVRYALAVVVGYLVNYLVLLAGLAIGINPYLAQAIAVGSCAVVSFLLFKFCVFRNRDSHAI